MKIFHSLLLRLLTNKRLVIIASLALASCTVEGLDECGERFEVAVLDRIEVAGDTVESSAPQPVVSAFGESLPIDVFYLNMNSCGEFNSINQMEQDLEVILKYEGCICNEVIQIEASRYDFIPEERGSFTLNFLSEDGENIVLNILVE
ncbi:MAG: hypothetical protein AAF740_03600 [Bacteroidota bacterium]